jgi:hypothetical protein
VTVRPGPDGPSVTDGPGSATTPGLGGFCVLEADNLDGVMEVARALPTVAEGAAEIWPMVEWSADVDANQGPNRWLALIYSGAEEAIEPGSDDWDAGAAEHGAFAARAGAAILGGGALHPPATATTLRSRDGQLLVTDGPFAETGEVANGLYLLRAASREEAIALGAQVPGSPRGWVELRPVLDVAGHGAT